MALKGFAQYYLRQAYEELEHALKLIRYMNKRGGRAKFCEIRAPERQVFCDAREALQTAMETEKKETCVGIFTSSLDYHHRLINKLPASVSPFSHHSSAAPGRTARIGKDQAGRPLGPVPGLRLHGTSIGLDERAGQPTDPTEHGGRWCWPVHVRQTLAEGGKKAQCAKVYINSVNKDSLGNKRMTKIQWLLWFSQF